MTKIVWHRVKKDRRCAVCCKPDWCTYSQEYSCCMRIPNQHPAKNGGYLYRHHEQVKIRVPATIKKHPHAQRDFHALHQEWERETDFEMVVDLAKRLFCSAFSLMSMGCCWSKKHQAWAFPIRDQFKNTIGIRLRSDDGRKWAVSGGRAGLFIPDLEWKEQLFVCEGPTDTAAALSVGLYAVGRHACVGQEEMLADFIRLQKIKDVVIIADNDEPGIRGAQRLQEHIDVTSRIWIPRQKDMREFVQRGGTKELAMSMVNDILRTKPKGNK